MSKHKKNFNKNALRPSQIEVTNFFQAIRQGKNTVVQHYLRQIPDVNKWALRIISHNNFFPREETRYIPALQYAIECAHENIVRLFLDHDANLLVRNKSQHFLFTAAENNNPDVLALLLSRWPEKYDLDALLERSILHVRPATTEYLAKAGAKVKDPGETLYYFIIANGILSQDHKDTLHFLLRQNPDVSRRPEIFDFLISIRRDYDLEKILKHQLGMGLDTIDYAYWHENAKKRRGQNDPVTQIFKNALAENTRMKETVMENALKAFHQGLPYEIPVQNPLARRPRHPQ